MKLDASEIEGLAAFCARRFPTGQERARFAAEAGLVSPSVVADATEPGDAALAWARLLREAQDRGALSRLLAAVATAAPKDENLQAARAILDDRPSSARWVVLGLGAAGLALVGAGILVWGGLSGAPPAVAPASVPVAAPPTAAPQNVPGSPTAAPQNVPAPLPATSVAAPPAPEPPAPPARQAGATTGCDGATSEVAGWWYAGTASPGAVGATITLDRDARVRADYPRESNHYDAQSPERCVLARGTRQHLSHAPVNVSGEHWWVPYAPGDSAP